MEKRFFDLATQYHGSLSSYAPFPKAEDRSFYESLPASLKKRLVADGEAFLSYTFPAILATDYMLFKRTGNRSFFEKIYFEKRHALNSLILAECVEYQGRFLDQIINGIFSLCEESGWQLPAHNSYIRDTPQLLLPDVTRPVLDLFACESGALLATAAYLLKERLDPISPAMIRRIQKELYHRIIFPYQSSHFWWMGKDMEPMCNWTVWCTQNVLLTAFLMPWLPATQELPSLSFTSDGLALLQKASESCDYFLKDYGDDGCCEEGAQYYRHAGLCLYGAMNVLNAVTGGAFSSLYEWDKIKQIAAYILNVHVDDKYYFNFADCSAIAGRAGVREYLFGKATHQKNLMLFGAKDFKAGGMPLYTDDVNRANLFYRLQTIFYYQELLDYDTSLPVVHQDLYYKSVGLFLVHSREPSCLSLAVKCGHNADSHNHNDTGSITLYKQGRVILADIGVETYTAKTFSDRRYEIWTMQSGYHNLPTICSLDQKDGKEYRASDVVVSLEGQAPSISLELASAYPLPKTKNTLPVSYRRSVTLDKEAGKVLIVDETNSDSVILNFITYEKPLLLSDSAKKSELSSLLIGDARFSYTGATLLCIEALPITDERLKAAWDHDLYRIRLQMQTNRFCCEIQ